MVFTAPGKTVFTPQTSVPGQYSDDGSNFISNNLTLRNCVLSDSNKKLTCEGTSINGGNSRWPANVYLRFAPEVAVDSSAASGATLSPAGTASITYNDVNTGQTNVNSGKCLNIAGGLGQGNALIQYTCTANGVANDVWLPV